MYFTKRAASLFFLNRNTCFINVHGLFKLHDSCQNVKCDQPDMTGSVYSYNRSNIINQIQA